MQGSVTSLTAAELQSAAVFHVSQLVNQANTRLHTRVISPDVSFRASGTRAGTAFLHQNRVNFHRTLLSHYPQAYFDQVIPHEVAHIIVHQLYGRVKPHGYEWRHIMQSVFQCAVEVTHSLDMSVLNKPTWPYKCECAEHALTARRHNAIARGKAKYRCRQCGTALIAI